MTLDDQASYLTDMAVYDPKTRSAQNTSGQAAFGAATPLASHRATKQSIATDRAPAQIRSEFSDCAAELCDCAKQTPIAIGQIAEAQEAKEWKIRRSAFGLAGPKAGLSPVVELQRHSPKIWPALK